VCTLALYFQVFDSFPIVVAANRDEHYDRPSTAPAVIGRNPAIVAGKDLVAGGTWLGVNEHGLVVGILNRRTNQEQKAGSFRSRGLLCIDLLGFGSAADAEAYLLNQEAALYQPFTVVIADRDSAWAASNLEARIESTKLGKELHVFSNAGSHNERCEKSSRAYALFNDVGKSEAGDLVSGFAGILKDHHLGNGSGDPRGALCVHGSVSGTVSSSILVYSRLEKQFRTFYCPGPPCRDSFSERSPIAVP
jgi:uncharacterized protein with NRDE domain